MPGCTIDWTKVAETFSTQAGFCVRENASPTSAAILSGCAAALRQPHALREILATADDLGPLAAVPLRVLGAVHRLALDGRAPELATLFPSCGGTAAPEHAWPLAEALLLVEADHVRRYLTRPPQTNEVGRSAMMLGGFLTVVAETGLPLRLLEIGASAGLNLFWDRYRVCTAQFVWGPPDSPLEIACDWTGPAPALAARIAVVARAGCDVAPVELANPDDRKRMESYIWTDQVERLTRLRTATVIALDEEIAVDRADAATWVEKSLATPAPGVATVLFHSIMWQYMAPDSATKVTAAIQKAGARATAKAPFAWLTMEPPGTLHAFPEIAVTVWPGGARRVLGKAHFHGAWMKWSGV
jgi:hypothetical protein